MSVLADYLTEEKLAAELDVTVRTLQRWRSQRVGPPMTPIGREPHYRIEAVKEWLRSREQKMVRERRRRAA